MLWWILVMVVFSLYTNHLAGWAAVLAVHQHVTWLGLSVIAVP